MLPQLASLTPPPSTRRNGKIARLPKETRDMINRMLDDGLPYKVIIDELGEAGEGLNLQNLTNWRQGGYQEWLKNQELIDRAIARTEHAIELIRETGETANPATIAQVGHTVGAVQLVDALMDNGDGVLKKMLAEKPETYIRILNVVCRLADSGLRYEKHHDLAKQAHPAIKPNQAQSSLIKP
jgi:hypothetical protein